MERTDKPRLPRDHPLRGCEEKLWRSHEHFELLQGLIGTLGDDLHPATFRTELKPRARGKLCTVVEVVDVVNEPHLRLATIIGDMVHNLRSSLDHLVFELAFLGLQGKKIPERTAFPGSTTKANWNSSYVQNTLLEGVLKKHRAMLYQVQPCYRRRDAPVGARTVRRRKRSPAADLQNLWNEDKHRMLQPVVVAASEIKPTISNFQDCLPAGEPRLHLEFLGRPLKAGAKVLTFLIRVTGPNPHVDVEIEVGCEIGFRNGLPVRHALAEIGNWVQSVIERFEPVFETKQARQLWGLPRGGWIEAEPLRRGRTWVRGWEIASGQDPSVRPIKVRSG